jgi:hypothetical protein
MTTNATTKENKFNSSFEEVSCFGDSITAHVAGFDVVAFLEFDTDYHINDDDCHNPDQRVTGCDDEQQKKLLAARRAWEQDKWHYCTLNLSVSKKGVMLEEYAVSVGGLEVNYPSSDNSYLTDLANELLEEALERGMEKLKSLLDEEEGEQLIIAGLRKQVMRYRAERNEFLKALQDLLSIAQIKWGNLDSDANQIMDEARRVINKNNR